MKKIAIIIGIVFILYSVVHIGIELINSSREVACYIFNKNFNSSKNVYCKKVYHILFEWNGPEYASNVIVNKFKQMICHKPFVFEGIYLGINIDEACNILNNKLGTKLITITGAEARMRGRDARIIDSYYASTRGIILKAGEDGRITDIYLSKEAVNKLFDVSELSAIDFAEKFINDYNIPYLEPYSYKWGEGSRHTGWQFISSTEFKLDISEDKEIRVEKCCFSK